MPSPKCAYCGAGNGLTREHLWPASLHKRLIAANGAPKNSFWLRRINAEIEGEPKIKDVCQSCNNGPLSELDNYICQLFDLYFCCILNRYESVQFEYDYHRLARWLLKMSFNSARIHSSTELFAYTHMLEYMLGHSKSNSRSIQIYVQLSYPGFIPSNRLSAPELQGCPTYWEPTEHRVGHLGFYEGEDCRILRAIHLRSYSFFVAFFSPEEKRSTGIKFAERFTSAMQAAELLMPSRTNVRLVCNGSDAWQSVDGARDNQFVSSSGVAQSAS